MGNAGAVAEKRGWWIEWVSLLPSPPGAASSRGEAINAGRSQGSRRVGALDLHGSDAGAGACWFRWAVLV